MKELLSLPVCRQVFVDCVYLLFNRLSVILKEHFLLLSPKGLTLHVSIASHQSVLMLHKI